jgi:hypothetical protein
MKVNASLLVAILTTLWRKDKHQERKYKNACQPTMSDELMAIQIKTKLN